MKPDETLGGLQNKDSKISSEELEEDGSTVTDRKIANTIQLCWLLIPFWCGELPLGVEAEPLGEWRGTPLECAEVQAQSWVPQQGVLWDTPMARWAGEGNDLEDVIHILLESMKQTVEKKAERNGTGTCLLLYLMYRRLGRGRLWKSEATAKRLWTGSMAAPS